MSHSFRATTYALRTEGELLTVYAELKDVAKAIDVRLKAQEISSKSLTHWAEKEHPQITEFIAKVLFRRSPELVPALENFRWLQSTTR
jgi:hypothetical protein